MYTATVTIKGKTWSVDVATTAAERAAGLSGLAELAPNTGMLFDMGSNQAEIAINMSSMLFHLDIVFMSNTQLVQGMMWEVEAGEQDVVATFPEGPGVRYFLEMNAGELGDITFGDLMTISGYTPPPSDDPTDPTPSPIDTGELIGTMITMLIVVMMMSAMTKMAKRVGGPVEPRLMGGAKLPPGYEPVV